MATETFSRLLPLVGEAGMRRLKTARVCVVGIGGVGCGVCQGLISSGIGRLTLIDGDVYRESNRNRQLFASPSNLGQNKAQAAKQHICNFYPECEVEAIPEFLTEDRIATFPWTSFDYVADCIDSVREKTALIAAVLKAGVPLISCMGTGNRLNPAGLRVMNLKETSNDALARTMRQRLRKVGIESVPVVCSSAPAENTDCIDEDGRHVPASSVFVPVSAGLMVAEKIVQDIAR